MTTENGCANEESAKNFDKLMSELKSTSSGLWLLKYIAQCGTASQQLEDLDEATCHHQVEFTFSLFNRAYYEKGGKASLKQFTDELKRVISWDES